MGAAAEVILPWALLELSNHFIFDIPPWSLWLVFGGPPAIACLTFIVDLMIRAAGQKAVESDKHDVTVE